jgi:hypothetical protein
MASTGAVVHFRPRFVAGTGVARSTGAVVYFSPRIVSGVYRAGIDDTLTRAPDVDLPNARVPIGWVNVNGKALPVLIDAQTWHKFFQTMWEARLGGFTGRSLADVATGVETVQASVSQSATTTAAVAAQTQANAEALATARQVLQDAALPGADQIPQVVTGLDALP